MVSTTTALVPRPPGPVDVGTASAAAELLRLAFLASRTGRTREAYDVDLRQWFTWCASRVVDPLAARRAHVDIYAGELAAAGRKPSTIARKLSALSSFYRYVAQEADAEGQVFRSPVQHVRRPRVSDESPRQSPDRGEAVTLLDAAGAGDAVDELLAALLLLNGLRVSEACNAGVGDVDQVGEHLVLTVVRKGGKIVATPLAGRTRAAYERRRAELGDVATPGTRLLGISRHAARRRIIRLAAAAGVTKPLCPHSLRHGFVTLSLEAGAALEDVQDGAGHADPKTTQRYNHNRRKLDRHPTHGLGAYLALTEDVA